VNQLLGSKENSYLTSAASLDADKRIRKTSQGLIFKKTSKALSKFEMEFEMEIDQLT